MKKISVFSNEVDNMYKRGVTKKHMNLHGQMWSCKNRRRKGQGEI